MLCRYSSLTFSLRVPVTFVRMLWARLPEIMFFASLVVIESSALAAVEGSSFPTEATLVLKFSGILKTA